MLALWTFFVGVGVGGSACYLTIACMTRARRAQRLKERIRKRFLDDLNWLEVRS